MRKIQAAIYYNTKKGFIFFPFGIMQNGPRIIIGPGIKKEKDATLIEIEENILKCLIISEQSVPIEKVNFNPNLALEVSGEKGYTKFNRLYQCVICEKKENGFYLENRTEKKETFISDSEIKQLGKSTVELLSQYIE